MPYVPHTNELRDRALHNTELGMSDKFVAALFGVSERSLRRWRLKKHKTGTAHVLRTASRGRPRILTSMQLREAINKLKAEPDIYMEELAQWCLERFGRSIAVQSLYTRLRRAGITRKRLRREAIEKDHDVCAVFARRQQRELPAQMCVWTDESSKDGRTIWRKYGWAPRGQRAVMRVPCRRGNRYSILPALTTDGYIAMRVVPGSVKSLEFIDFICQDVVRVARILGCVLILPSCQR